MSLIIPSYRMSVTRATDDEFPNRAGVWAVILRPNGMRETTELTSKFPSMNSVIAAKIKMATENAGKGKVEKIVYKQPRTNELELERKYSRGFLEGGEGYVPDMTKHREYKQWIETEVF